uniref:Uncharacterized protein n=1 Tax=Kryptolebias marmoratus TaxID=37003 RepID=A0A3Q3BEQ8_KRYMA
MDNIGPVLLLFFKLMGIFLRLQDERRSGRNALDVAIVAQSRPAAICWIFQTLQCLQRGLDGLNVAG